MNKINVLKIIKAHLNTLVNHNTAKAGTDEWITFFGVPFLTALLLVIFKKDVSSNTVNLIITVLSIFVGLLINVLVLVFSLIQKESETDIKIVVLKETIVNISYTIIISIATIIFCFLMFFDNYIVRYISSFFIFFLTTHFFATLLMIVKRMYQLFINELDEFKKLHDKKNKEDLKRKTV